LLRNLLGFFNDICRLQSFKPMPCEGALSEKLLKRHVGMSRTLPERASGIRSALTSDAALKIRNHGDGEATAKFLVDFLDRSYTRLERSKLMIEEKR
jgi:hypothetical protein